MESITSVCGEQPWSAISSQNPKPAQNIDSRIHWNYLSNVPQLLFSMAENASILSCLPTFTASLLESDSRLQSQVSGWRLWLWGVLACDAILRSQDETITWEVEGVATRMNHWQENQRKEKW